jgi:hypothetical protein
MIYKDLEFPSIESFETGAFDVERFTHEAHVYVAWSYLQKTPLTDAIARFSGALKRITLKLGIPGKYHETITWFFMLMVAQRREASTTNDWVEFRDANQDLVGEAKDLLDRYYTGELLASDSARRVFMLPDKVA